MDIDKTRATYVVELEEKVRYLQEQLMHYKPLAEKWTPVLNGQVEPNGACRVTLAFGGKRVTGEVSSQYVLSSSVNDITVAITDTLIESLVTDILRAEVKPEVERLQRGLSTVRKSAL